MHAGTGDKLVDGVDFVARDGRCHFIDIEKLASKLQSSGDIAEYVQLMQASPNSERLQAFLRGKKINSQEIIKPASFAGMPANAGASVNALLRDRHGQPYLPGTAIKGAIRTAILWSMLRELQKSDEARKQTQFSQQVEYPITNSRMPRGWQKKYLGDFLNLRFYQNVLGKSYKPDANADLLRAMRVRDSKTLDPGLPVLQSVRVISLGDRGQDTGWHWSRNIETMVECLPENTELETEICVDELMLEDLGLNRKSSQIPACLGSVKGIIDACCEFSAYCIRKEEKPYYEKLKGVDSVAAFYDTVAPTLRIGWGSGRAETTILSLLKGEARKKVQELAGRRDAATFPKTRRTTMNGAIPNLPLGWVKMETIP